MPADHQKYLEWNGDRFRKWAERIGINTYTAVNLSLIHICIGEYEYSVRYADGKKYISQIRLYIQENSSYLCNVVYHKMCIRDRCLPNNRKDIRTYAYIYDQYKRYMCKQHFVL